MTTERKPLPTEHDAPVVIVKSHVISREGSQLRVGRIELSEIGTALITSTSRSIPDLEPVPPEQPREAESMRARG